MPPTQSQFGEMGGKFMKSQVRKYLRMLRQQILNPVICGLVLLFTNANTSRVVCFSKSDLQLPTVIVNCEMLILKISKITSLYLTVRLDFYSSLFHLLLSLGKFN